MKYNAFVDCVGNLANELIFLSGATEEAARRPYMEYIYITQSESGEEGQLCGVATDGRRLHVVDPLYKSATAFGLVPGYWRVFKKIKKPVVWVARVDDPSVSELTFPDYKKIIPTGTPEYQTKFSGFCYGNTFRRNYGELAKFIHDFPDATAINLEYLHDLGIGFDWAVDWYGSQKPLKFTDANRMAVIMPMIID